MERHEIKALVDGRMAAGKRSLDAMKTRLESEREQFDEKYRENVEQLQREHDQLKARAQRAMDAASEDSDSAGKDLERSVDDWEARAKQAMDQQPK